MRRAALALDWDLGIRVHVYYFAIIHVLFAGLTGWHYLL